MTETSYSIFGASPFARMVSEYISRFGKGKVSEFIVDENYKKAQHPDSVEPVIWSEFKNQRDFRSKQIVFAIGYECLARKQTLYERLVKDGANLVNLCLTNKVFGPINFVGNGNILLPGTVIEPNVKIGNGNILWTGSHVCHDVIIENFNFFAANSVIGGYTSVGSRNFFGFSVSVRNNIKLLNDITLGMGATCPHSIIEPGTYIGAPARPIYNTPWDST